MPNVSEWDDMPTTSELFGGDFFGDELMEMYSAIGEAPPSSAVTAVAVPPPPAAEEEEDDRSHPGLLIAMNAAAMDSGLGPLGSAPEPFVPMTAPSNADAAAAAAELTPYPPPTAALEVKVKVEPAPAPPPPLAAPVPLALASLPAPLALASLPAPLALASLPAPLALASLPAPLALASLPAPLALASHPASATKRPVAQVAPSPSKKRKGGVFAPCAAAPRARVAATGGIRVSLPPGAAGGIGAPVAAARPVGGRAVSPSGAPRGNGAAAQPPPGVVAPLRRVSVPGVAAVVPRSKMPVGGGINHQVVARPSAIPSSASAHRIMPLAPSLSAGVRAPGLIGARKPDILPSMLSPTGVIRAKSEADFKEVASAAVSSLIQNASSGTLAKTGPKPPPPAVAPSIPKPCEKAVDVSTAHINALTSQNWVTACNPVPAPEAVTNPAGPCDKAARNARRAALTQEERAKQNRDRNREHARNTRLRKKAYVEELKRTLTELVARRDAADLERRHEAQREREQREVRFRVMEEFLRLRGRNEPNAARWVAILEDGFAFALPRTTFRRMVDVEKSSANDVDGVGALPRSPVDQVLRGAAAVMEDSQHLSTYLQSIGGAPAGCVTQVQIAYRCDRKRFFMDGNVAFMDFNANTIGAVAKGALNEVTHKGSMRASFSPASNKLISVDMEFDTTAFVQQVDSIGDVSTTAAAVAAHEADVLLDSLQMPQIFADKKEGPVSVSSDDGERSTDGRTVLLNA